MTTSVRTNFLHLLDVFLRVPPVFIMDLILTKEYPYQFGQRVNTMQTANLSIPEFREEDFNESMTKKYLFVSSISFDLNTVINILINASGFALALTLFTLSREHLLETYKWLTACATLFMSYYINTKYIDSPVFYPFETASTFLLHFVLQLFLTVIFCATHGQCSQEGLAVALAFLVPSVINGIGLLSQVNAIHVPFLTSVLITSYITLCLILRIPRIIHEIISAVRVTRIFIRYYGIHALVENEWMRLNVPRVLRIFWLLRTGNDLTVLLHERLQSAPEVIDYSKLLHTSLAGVGLFAKQILVRSCDTLIAVLGLTSMVASLTHYFGCLIQQFLLTDDDDEKSIGTVSAVLFFVLALQTGLTGLDPEKRFIRLYRNFCLLFTAILHFLHNIVNPLLMSLSASRNRSVQRHTRVLIVCGLLIAFPCWFLFYLWTSHSLSTWMLAVSAFTVEVVIKVVISLLLYFLFMIDAYRNSFWEKLDDYIYYIRATGNTIEFFFGIFLFFNGAWILLFESGGAIRACMMCIHAYINIWLQAKAGWRTFIKRRTAVNKINSLPEATEEQLEKFDDVCAICYQELTNARITKCNHYFHGVCLRKWLYVQDKCPLCHNTLYKLESDGEDEREGEEAEGESEDGRGSETNSFETVDEVDEGNEGNEDVVRQRRQ